METGLGMETGYIWGWVAIIVFWLVGWITAGKKRPWALAIGNDGNLSGSLLQFLIFTGVTIFAYVSAFAARAIEIGASSSMPLLPEIPINLLILMGFSVATASSSKSVTVSYLQSGDLPKDNKGNAVKGRDGKSDLTKVQMIVWTLIAAVIYIVGFRSFMSAKCYLPSDLREKTENASQCPEGFALPDIDGALLILLGASQGGYVAGKLVTRSFEPKINHTLPTSVKVNGKVSVYGTFLGEGNDGENIIILSEVAGENEKIPIDSEFIEEWTDSKIVFKLPDKAKPKGNESKREFVLEVMVNSRTVQGDKLSVSPSPAESVG